MASKLLSSPVESPEPELRRKTAAAVNRWYDERMFARWAVERFAGSDFHNYGYWTPDTHTQTEACERLIETLLAFIPNKNGTILDVACGKGASSRYLCKYYAPQCVTGINISKKQLRKCRLNAPGCSFLLMDAADMAFRDESFDNILCVEAAMHFVTREKFFRDAHRLLKPEGRLVLSDLLLRQTGSTEKPLCPTNRCNSRDEYRELLAEAGFEDLQITDATTECKTGSMRYSMALLRTQLHDGKIDLGTFEEQKARLAIQHRAVAAYLLVCARKTHT
jgi:MPBQ/MSBQ methyltransferase